MRKRIAIISTHPIQYNAPLFKILSQKNEIELKVFYTWGHAVFEKKYDPGFKRIISWDIPLLEGYNYVFVDNVSVKKGSHHFNGIVNPGLKKLLTKWEPFAIIVFGWAFRSHLEVLRAFKNKALIIFRGDSTLLDESPGIKKLLRRCFLRWVYGHIDYALVTGTNNKKYFLKNGLKLQQLVYAPHAVDNLRFDDLSTEYEAKATMQRKELGYKDDDIVLLFAGKFEAKKNPFFLLDVLNRIKDSKLKVLFVGAGELEHKLRDAASVDARVQFLGFQNQHAMPIVYRIADIFILPSKGPGETWGLALNEAMACGKPVVASDKVGGAIDLIKHGENGLIVSEKAINNLDILILKALSNKNDLKLMGNKSKEIIKSFSFDHIANSLLAIINDLDK